MDELQCVVLDVSGSLHTAWTFDKYRCWLKSHLLKNNVFWKLVFGELRRFCGNEDWRDDDNLECRLCLRMCTLDKKTPNPFSIWFVSRSLWTRCLWMFLNVFACCMWATGNLVYLLSEMFPTTFAWPRVCIDFNGCLLLWKLMLQHGARQQKNNRAQCVATSTVASSQDTLLWFCRVAWKWSKSVANSETVLTFSTCMHASVFIGSAAAAPPRRSRTRTTNFRIESHTHTVLCCKVRYFYLPVTRKYCFLTSFDNTSAQYQV